MKDNWLLRKLGLKTPEIADVHSSAGKVESVSDFLESSLEKLEKVKGTRFAEAIASAAPWWTEGVIGTLVDATPVVKVVAKLFAKISELKKPDELALLACTMAFQRAVELAARSVDADGARKPLTNDVSATLRALGKREDYDFKRFSYERALEHLFVTDAIEALTLAAEHAGYGDAQRRKLIAGVQRHFVAQLKELVSHRDLKERFAPFVQWMDLDRGEHDAYCFLEEEADRQRRLYEEEPLFGREPFSLADVYVETECGVLRCGDVREKRVNPFLDEHGGREPLLPAVMKLLADPTLKDAIVVQGVAGVGKSSFTLRLCAELAKEGLTPIRVRLRDVPFDNRHATETLAEALGRDRDPSKPAPYPKPKDPFVGGSIWNELVKLGDAEICRHVLILDGWDEISVTASESFQARLRRLLDQVRESFLKTKRVRVVITGRPSIDVDESGFLRADTPLLTMRPMREGLLASFVARLKTALERPTHHVEGWEPWKIPSLEPFEAAKKMEILGLPLLAFLAARVIAQSPSVETANSTALYRSLIDLTVKKAGKPESSDLSTDDIHAVSGHELRALLHGVAEAATVMGGESIGYDELELRLGLSSGELDTRAQSATKDTLSKLVISFFFKGGRRDLGCEFLHKSFREYLFAEAIVDQLKRYAASTTAKLPRRAKREFDWRDFEEDDPRRDFSRRLGKMLAPQWLSFEVADHLKDLIEWELERARAPSATKSSGLPTKPLTIDEWEQVRDGLADVWDWWSDGVHLRPVVTRDKRKQLDFAAPFVLELIEWHCPQHVGKDDPLPAPTRTATMDAHLGDGLFRIAAHVHFFVAAARGWLAPRDASRKPLTPTELWNGARPRAERPCQTVVHASATRDEWILFAPFHSRGHTTGVQLAARINTAGGRPGGAYPGYTDILGVDFSRAELQVREFSFPVGQFVWEFINLAEAALDGSEFSDTVLRSVFARRASLRNVEILLDTSGDFEGAVFYGAWIGEFSPDSSVKGALIGSRTRIFFRRRDIATDLVRRGAIQA